MRRSQTLIPGAIAAVVVTAAMWWLGPDEAARGVVVATRPGAPARPARPVEEPQAESRSVMTLASESRSAEAPSVELSVPSDLAGAVHAHVRRGEFETASSLAAEASDEQRTDLLTAAYHAWAQRDPEVAVDTALGLDDPARRRTAFHAAVSGWARVDPRQLAQCARDFPEGPEKTFALGVSLRAWRKLDAAAAREWITTHRVSLAVIWED